MRHFAQEKILWPRRLYTGGRAGQIVFAPLVHSRVLGILHGVLRALRVDDGASMLF